MDQNASQSRMIIIRLQKVATPPPPHEGMPSTRNRKEELVLFSSFLFHSLSRLFGGLSMCRFDTIHVTSNDITNSYNRNQKVFPIFRSRKHHAKNNVRFLFSFFIFVLLSFFFSQTQCTHIMLMYDYYFFCARSRYVCFYSLSFFPLAGRGACIGGRGDRRVSHRRTHARALRC